MKSIFRVLGVFVVVAGVVLLGGCPKATGESDPATLTIMNNSSYIINEFYCTESTNTDWGSDLFSGSIAPGGTQDFSIPAGTFDMDAEETTGKAYWDSYDEVFVSGAAYDWILTDANAMYSIIGTWLNSTGMPDAFSPGIDMKAGATTTFAIGTYSTAYIAVDTGDSDTEYNCSHSGTIIPTDPDSSSTFMATVTASDGGGSVYRPDVGSELQFFISNLTATAADIGVDMTDDGVADMTMSCVRQ